MSSRFRLLYLGLAAFVLTGGLLGCDALIPWLDEEEQQSVKRCTPVASTQGPVGEWERLGLREEISAVAVNPCDPRMIYASSGHRLTKSNDGGATWDTLRTASTVDIEINPERPDTVYVLSAAVSDGVLKSTVAGKTWTNVSEDIDVSTGDRSPRDLEISPRDPETLYLGTGGFFGGPLYKSSTGGSSWKELGKDTRGLDGITDVVISSDDPQTVYVQTSWEFDLYMSPDGGQTWLRRGDPKLDLQVAPHDASTLYGLETVRKERKVQDRLVVRSDDGGRSWNLMEDGLPDGKAIRLALDERSGMLFLLYAAEEAKRSLRVYMRAEWTDWQRVDSEGLNVPEMPSVDSSNGPVLFAKTLVVAPDHSLYLGTQTGLYRMTGGSGK